MSKKYLSDAHLCERLAGVSRMWLWRKRQTDSTFPKAIKLGGRLNFTDEDEFEAWQNAQAS